MNMKITAALLTTAACSSFALGGGCCSGPTADKAPMATTVGYGSDSKMNIVETAVDAGQFTTLAAALKAANLVSTLEGKGPFTVFAPTDAAFAKLPAGTVEALLKPENRDQLTAILTYHVVPQKVTASQVVNLSNASTVNGQRIDISTKGGGVMVDGANVVKTDITASNGVIHVIDEVILPNTNDVVDTAVMANDFNTLVAAVKAAGLASTLKGDGPFTIFAPTDEAFAKLPEGTVESLLKPENRDKLVKILTYHVVKGRVYSDQVVQRNSVRTLEGSRASISLTSVGPQIDTANIVMTDIDASNGVIHVIDRVIMPN